MTAAWQFWGPVLYRPGMLGSFVSRFYVLIILLAFALGLAGQVLSSAAMAAQMQGPAQTGVGIGTVCPGCDADMQYGGLAPSCTVGSCWTIPALPPQSTTLEQRPAAVFPASVDAIVTGFASAPDPHPPRAVLHS